MLVELGPRALVGRAALEAWLRAWIAEQLGLTEQALRADEPLRSYGIDSLRGTQMLAALSSLIGRELGFDVIWSHPTLGELAAFLAEPDAARVERATVPATRPTAAADAAQGSEPIALIGMSCRLPGAADPTEYWALLRAARSAIGEVPLARTELAALRDDRSPGARFGGFLPSVDGFDAAFFGISPREALHMDPQQRLMLELAWEGLADAGIPASSLRGGDAGVFAAVAWSDYLALLQQAGTGELGPYSATGTHHSIVANRISYLLGLQGPSLSVDSACSSSLVALHLACQSLRAEETSLALVGAVNLIVSPHSSLAMSRMGALSPNGRLCAFDARANGYVRGEGGGLVVLKRLSQALSDGDPIYCVILGSAVNNDGRSNGLTAPNPRAQVDVLRAAYRRSGVQACEVDYVEAHGTGTELGDPIELTALGEVLGSARPAERPLRVGSVKTNLGHLEAAAGMAGLIKLALAIEHASLPASLNYAEPNPHVSLARLQLEIQAHSSPWPRRKAGRVLAGISAFGFGGTNCHAVVSGPPERPGMLALSAATQVGLRRAAARGLRLLDGDADCVVSNEAERSGDAHRATLAYQNRQQLRERLEALVSGRPVRGVSVVARGRTRPRLAFVCPPQGGQWLGMARSLLATEPAFLREVSACDRIYAELSGISLLDELRATPERSRLGELAVVQPLLFTVAVGLGALLREWGVQPDAVIGHSLGEVAASHLAGALDREQALGVVLHYAGALQHHGPPGRMALVELSAAETARRLEGRARPLWIGACNGPTTTMISGDEADVRAFGAELRQAGVACFIVEANRAAHSPRMAALQGPLARSLCDLLPSATRVPMISCVTGSLVTGPQLGADYWAQNLGSPVRFVDGVQRLIDFGIDAFVELGPHPALCRPIASLQRERGQDACALGTLRRLRKEQDDRGPLMETLSALYLRGAAIDWRRVDGGRSLPRRMWCLLPSPERASEPPGASAMLLPLSAQSEPALRELALGVANARDAGDDLADLADHLALRRDHHEHRLAVVARGGAELRDRLVAHAAGQPAPGVVAGQAGAGGSQLGWVFSGQGSQWLQMGAQTYRHEPVFRAALDACMDAIHDCTENAAARSLEAWLAPEGDRDRVDRVQPALFAIQVALGALYRSWGITPTVVVGHSMGEVAAAHVAGILSLADAAQVVSVRSALAQRSVGQGGMALVELSLEEARLALSGYEDRLSIAASNGPCSTVLSGEPGALAELLPALERREVFCRAIRVEYASHSAQMEPFLDALRGALGAIEPAPGALPFLSTVTGQIEPGTSLDAGYWCRNLREPVLFFPAIAQLIRSGCRNFVELSPHPILTNAIMQSLAHASATGAALPSLVRDRDERPVLLETLGTLYTLGYPIAWQQLARGQAAFVRLPGYRWQRERYWVGRDGAEAPSQAAPAPATAAAIKAADALARVPAARRPAWLLDYVSSCLARVLRIDPAQVSPDTPLTMLGLDSLTAGEARARIESELSQRCPVAWLLRGSVHDVAAALAREAGASEPTADLHAFSEEQRNAWVRSALLGERGAVLHRALRVAAPFAHAAFERAWHALVARHELLGLRLPLQTDEAIQAASPSNGFETLAATGDDATLLARLKADCAGGYGGHAEHRGALLRARVYRRDEREFWLLLSAHRVVADEIALELLSGELLALLFGAGVTGPAPSYRRYLEWQRQSQGLHAPAFAARQSFFRARLAGGASELALAPDRVRPARASRRGLSVEVQLPADLEGLPEARVHALLLCAFELLLARQSGQSRFSLAVLSDRRGAADCLGVVGPCTYPLLMQADFGSDSSVDEAVRSTEAEWKAGLAHAGYSLASLVQELRIARRAMLTAPFQATFCVRERVALPANVAAEWLELDVRIAEAELGFEIERAGARRHARLVASAELFSVTAAQHLADQLAELIAMMLRRPELRTAELRAQAPHAASDSAPFEPAPCEPAEARLERALAALPEVNRAWVVAENGGAAYLLPTRRVARFDLTLAARVELGEQAIALRIEGLSTQGAGASGVPAFWQVGQAATLELELPGAEAGVRVSAQLVWRRGNRGGLRLRMPLPASVRVETRLRELAGRCDPLLHRHELRGAVRAQWRGGEAEAVVVSIADGSLAGLRVCDPPHDWKPGTQLRLQLWADSSLQSQPDQAWLDARVCWCAEGAAGVSFDAGERQSEALRDAVSCLLPGELDLGGLDRRLRHSLAEGALPDAIAWLPPGELGRGSCSLRALAAPPLALSPEPNSALEAVIAATFCELLGVARVSRTDDFFALGGDSLGAFQLLARVRAALDVELPLSHVLVNPTPAGLADEAFAALERPGRGQPQRQVGQIHARWIVPLRRSPAGRVRLIGFPNAGGGPAMYQAWAGAITEHVQLFSVCLPGREHRFGERPYKGFFQLCRELARAIAPLADRPLCFFGHSFGALVAFETARLLRQQIGVAPAWLFLAGFPAPRRWRRTPALRQLGRPDVDLAALLPALGGSSRMTPAAATLAPVLRSDLALLFGHRHVDEAPLACPISVLGGAHDPLATEEDLAAWRKETDAAFSLRLFPGDHFFLQPEQAAVLAAVEADLATL
jgi:acyl transferase domain-containing protein/surfactin synthase thioesterase subunit/aryl carrier-like protein